MCRHLSVLNVLAIMLVWCVVLGVAPIRAETIFETFDADPTASGWTNVETGSNTFSYNAAGYLDIVVYRDSANLSWYTSSLAGALDENDEFWWEMDAMLVNGSTHDWGMALCGLFDGASAAFVGCRFASPSPGNRYDLWSQNATASYDYWLGPTPVEDNAAVRVLGHYWPSGGVGYAQLTVVDLTSGLTIGSTGPQVVLSAGAARSFTRFGVGNRTDNSLAGPTRCRLDNLYFSTEGPNADRSWPSFLTGTSVFAMPKMDSLTVNTEVENYTGDPVTVRVRHRVYANEDPASTPFLELLSDPFVVAAGAVESQQSVATGLTPNLWSPESPELYLLRTETLDTTGAVVFRVDTTIGFRTFEIMGKHFYLNGDPIYLKSFHMTPPGRIPSDIYNDPAFIDTHITRLRDYNVNFVRLGEGAPQSWFDACDRAGLMVMAGCYGGTTTSDPTIWERNLEKLEVEIPRVRNHSCVVIWYIGNEWVLSSSGMKQAAENLYYAAKELDDSRPMFNTWAAKYFSGDLIGDTGSDFLDYHNYTGWYSGSVYSFYDYKTYHSYPTTLSECVGAYTSYDPDFGAFCLKGDVEDKYRANLLRHIGHSYDLGRDSLDYQAYLTTQLAELCRRGRGPDSSFCGAMAFTYGYAYDCYEDPGNITEYPKPVMAALAEVLRPVHVVIHNPYPNAYPEDSLPVRFQVLNDDRANYLSSLPASQLHVSLLRPDDQSVWQTTFEVPAVDYYDSWDELGSVVVPGSAVQGEWTIRAELTVGSEPIAVTEQSVFVAPRDWHDVAETPPGLVALYDPAGLTQVQLEQTGLDVSVLTNWSNLSTYQALIIGKNGFNQTVFSHAAQIEAFLASGKRVLILEQDSSTVEAAIDGNTWLGTNLRLSSGGGEDFVNIERPQISTLMQGLDRRDFRIWNRNNSTADQDRTVFNRYYAFDKGDLDRIAVLGNAGQHLVKPVLLEIFPPSGGSCILSQLRLIDRHRDDPKAGKFLANLLDYFLEETPHHQHVLVGREIHFGDFATERGLFASPLLQGMHFGYTGEPYQVPGAGRDFRGVMQFENGLGYLEEGDPADREICPVYLRTGFDLGRTPIIVDVQNKYSQSLGFRLIFNGQALPWTSVPAGQRQQYTFSLPVVIPAGTNVKLEIDAEEGSHVHGYSTGLCFHSLRLSLPGDMTYDDQLSAADLSVLCQYWLSSGQFAPQAIADLNLDEKINLHDFVVFGQCWIEADPGSM